MKRGKLCALGMFLLVLCGGSAFGAYPEKPITHIVPASAGGGWDTSSRIVTDQWGEILGKPFKYSYVPGASGMIGMKKLAATGENGYQTGIITFNMVNMADRFQKGAGANWNDLAFVGNIITDQDAIFVHKDSEFQTLQDLIEYGKTSEKPLRVGTAHPQAVSTLAALLFIRETGINATVVSFNGGSASRKALAGKHVDMIVSASASAVSMKDFFRGLGVFAKDNKAAGIFDMPTMGEALPDILFPSFLEPFGIVVARSFKEKHPEEYATLVESFEKAMTGETAVSKAKPLGMENFLDYWTPEECQDFVDAFDGVLDQYGDLLRR